MMECAPIIVAAERVLSHTLSREVLSRRRRRIFEAALVTVCGFWLLSSLNRHLARAVEADSQWGIATMRQRVLARLEAFISTAEEFNHLPELRGVASQLLELLQKVWPEMRPLPLYPAFLRALSE